MKEPLSFGEMGLLRTIIWILLAAFSLCLFLFYSVSHPFIQPIFLFRYCTLDSRSTNFSSFKQAKKLYNVRWFARLSLTKPWSIPSSQLFFKTGITFAEAWSTATTSVTSVTTTLANSENLKRNSWAETLVPSRSCFLGVFPIFYCIYGVITHIIPNHYGSRQNFQIRFIYNNAFFSWLLAQKQKSGKPHYLSAFNLIWTPDDK